jgi:hypothetical protein
VTSDLFEPFGVSLSKFLGGDVSIKGRTGNAALDNLKTLIAKGALRLSGNAAANRRTSDKIRRILVSQKAAVTADEPSRFLWMSNVDVRAESAQSGVRSAVCEGGRPCGGCAANVSRR